MCELGIKDWRGCSDTNPRIIWKREEQSGDVLPRRETPERDAAHGQWVGGGWPCRDEGCRTSFAFQDETGKK